MRHTPVMNEQPPTTPDAQGKPWSEEEDARLVRALAAGTSINEIATAHGRSRGAITSRMERMVPSAHSRWPGGQMPMSASGRKAWLVQQLQAGNYPWQQVLASRTGTPPASGAPTWGTESSDELQPPEESADASPRSSLGRAYETWTEQEWAQLVAGLHAGLPLEDIAANLQRKDSAVRTQAARMVPAAAMVEGSKSRRLDWLREQLLADAEYDWRTPLRANTDGPVWLKDDDAQLTHGWHAGTGLPQLARQFNCSEHLIVRRLMTLRLASGSVQVVDHLGCTPGGTVETHYLLATDAARAQLQLLVGSEDVDGVTVHLSVHSSITEAAERAAKVDQLRARTEQAPLHWLTGQRRVDIAYLEDELHPLGEQPCTRGT